MGNENHHGAQNHQNPAANPPPASLRDCVELLDPIECGVVFPAVLMRMLENRVTDQDSNDFHDERFRMLLDMRQLHQFLGHEANQPIEPFDHLLHVGGVAFRQCLQEASKGESENDDGHTICDAQGPVGRMPVIAEAVILLG